jgi:hypothetical protein
MERRFNISDIDIPYINQIICGIWVFFLLFFFGFSVHGLKCWKPKSGIILQNNVIYIVNMSKKKRSVNHEDNIKVR